jgi:hypothetical protein
MRLGHKYNRKASHVLLGQHAKRVMDHTGSNEEGILIVAVFFEWLSFWASPTYNAESINIFIATPQYNGGGGPPGGGG